MLSLSISQAQKQFTSLLTKATTIIDKKSKVKKAVILPYETYEKLIARNANQAKVDLDSFVGILSNDVNVIDERYDAIIKS